MLSTCWKRKKYKMTSEGTYKYGVPVGPVTEVRILILSGLILLRVYMLGWVWWRIPLMPALRRQRQMCLLVQDQLGWHSEFQNSQGCLDSKTNKQTNKRICLFLYLIVLIANVTNLESPVRWAPENTCGQLSWLHKWGGKIHPLLEVPVPDWSLWAYKSGALTVWAQAHKR